MFCSEKWVELPAWELVVLLVADAGTAGSVGSFTCLLSLEE